MNKIKSFLIYNLTKDSVVEYLHIFIEMGEKCPAVLLYLSQWFTSLQTAFAEMERIFHITLKSQLTELIAMVDGQRDSIIVAIKALVRSFEKSEDGLKRDAARRLMVGLTSIKHNNNDQYVAQTGQVDNLLYFLLVEEAADVELLGIGASVTLLKDVNDRMHELILQRVAEVENKENGAFARARTAAEEAYRQFVLSVNSWAFVNESKLDEIPVTKKEEGQMTLAEFIRWANANIDFYNQKVLKLPAGGSGSGEGEGEGEGEGDEELEVPAGDRGSANFHFINGEHETFTGVPGTPFEIPASTFGYKWVPTPDGFIPEVDTQYFEELAQQILNPAENITIKFRGTDNQVLHEFVVPVDYQMPESEYPTPPEGTHWNFTLADLNLAIGMKNPGDTITVRAQAN